MAVTEHHHLRVNPVDLPLHRPGQSVGMAQDMDHEDGDAEKLQPSLRMKLWGPLAFIDVSAHRADGRQGLEPPQDVEASQIACVQDVINAGEKLDNFRVQQPVGVGNDASNRRLRHRRNRSLLLWYTDRHF